jgi:sulfur carrier protein
VRITVNGESYSLNTGNTLADLLNQMQTTVRANGRSPLQCVSIAINQHIVPRSEIERTNLNEGDRIELVRAVGGG